MATFVLIHGGMYGAWCWEPIVERLSAAGHTVVAPDLPGMGDDPTPHAEIDLARNAEFVADVVRRQGCPVVLVGHSMGGLSISEAAERVPDAVAGLVYLSASLLPAGKCLVDDGDMEQRFDGPLIRTEDGLSFILAPETALATFYNTSPPEAAREAVKRLQLQPVRPMRDPLTITEARYGRVPRAFIECTEDRAVNLARARAMQAVLPCDPVFALPTDHSPFLCMPDELTSCLIAAAEAFGRRRRKS